MENKPTLLKPFVKDNNDTIAKTTALHEYLLKILHDAKTDSSERFRETKHDNIGIIKRDCSMSALFQQSTAVLNDYDAQDGCLQFPKVKLLRLEDIEGYMTAATGNETCCNNQGNCFSNEIRGVRMKKFADTDICILCYFQECANIFKISLINNADMPCIINRYSVLVDEPGQLDSICCLAYGPYVNRKIGLRGAVPDFYKEGFFFPCLRNGVEGIGIHKKWIC